jgi:hypothetical protein
MSGKIKKNVENTRILITGQNAESAENREF